MIVTNNPRVIVQLRRASVTEAIGAENYYEGTALVGETVRRAHDDALAWIEDRRAGDVSDSSGPGGGNGASEGPP